MYVFWLDIDIFIREEKRTKTANYAATRNILFKHKPMLCTTKKMGQRKANKTSWVILRIKVSQVAPFWKCFTAISQYKMKVHNNTTFKKVMNTDKKDKMEAKKTI